MSPKPHMNEKINSFLLNTRNEDNIYVMQQVSEVINATWYNSNCHSQLKFIS
jgi:hypothetical protein